MEKIVRVCLYCGGLFTPKPSLIASGGGRYCSKYCQDNARSCGGYTTHDCGYILIKLPNHPKANKLGFVYEHILVTEQTINRPLRVAEIVHHINGNPQDNRPENLMVFANNSEHQKHHARQRSIKFGINPDAEKWCNKCKRILPKTQFSPSSSRGKPTLSSRCKDCCAEDQRNRRQKISNGDCLWVS